MDTCWNRIMYNVNHLGRISPIKIKSYSELLLTKNISEKKNWKSFIQFFLFLPYSDILKISKKRKGENQNES